MSKKIETNLLPPVSNPEHERALKEILIDFERRIGRLEKLVIVLAAIVVAVGGREYVISALLNAANSVR